ncbi:secreted protein [Rhodopirellula sallentina SM41]|uniref:Secreted protein n=2 Tax=Rhodopirellula TaxID=265488 RepID=M5U8B5_9BACT|nr:secreted protein [Rhodopirellula sallentina SM41]
MNRVLSALLLTAVSLSIFAGQSAQAAGPKLRAFTNETARFDALMPAGVTNETIPGKNLVDTEYRSTAHVSGAKFQVRVRVLIPIEIDDKDLLDQYGESMVEQAEEQYIKAFGQPSSSKRMTQNGSKGKDFTFRISGSRTRDGKDLVIRRRILFDGQRLYQVIAEGAPSVMDSRQTNDFMDSVGPML